MQGRRISFIFYKEETRTHWSGERLNDAAVKGVLDVFIHGKVFRTRKIV